MCTIDIEEIPVLSIDEFWDLHLRYLVDDSIISEAADIAYFQGEEYRETLRAHMLRPTDKHHMVYFLQEGRQIGAAQYTTYKSEDGKCFLLDFWVFPQYRGNGTGHQCFDALYRYTKANGACYYEINCTKEDAHRFWSSIGFVDFGFDEDEMPLMRLYC